VISSDTAGMSDRLRTMTHSRRLIKWVLKIVCRNGTVHTNKSRRMETPTAICIHLFEKTPMRKRETLSERTV
jgi:hypothetical protein